MRVGAVRLLGFACVWAASRVSFAQAEPVVPEIAPVETEEDTLVREALDRRRAGQHQDAAALLRRAYAIRRSPRACGQLAFAEQAIGRWARAEALFREALSASNDPWIERNREALEGSMNAAARRLATVEIVGGDDGAELWVDGERAGVLPADRSLRVVVGAVRVEHRPPAGPITTRVVELAPGGRERVYFAPRDERPRGNGLVILEPSRGVQRPVERPAPRGVHPLVWFGAAGSAAAGAVVAIAWATGNGIASEYDRTCFGAAMPDRSACDARRVGDQQTLDGLTVVTGVSWALFGAGVASAGVGVGLSLWGRGASVQGRF